MSRMYRPEIRRWVEENARLMPEAFFTLPNLDHMAMCMERIHQWYYEDVPLGQFLTAVVKNDFNEACIRADDVSRRALYLYALFLVNRLPYDYIEKANR